MAASMPWICTPISGKITTKICGLPVGNSMRSLNNNFSKASPLSIQDNRFKKKMQLSPVNCNNNFIDGLGSQKEVVVLASDKKEAVVEVGDEIFIRWCREAQLYFEAHPGCTFVVIISGEIMDSYRLDPILKGISRLHGLGIKFVLIPETHVLLAKEGIKPKFPGPYQITDDDSLEAAMKVDARIQIMLRAKLTGHCDNSPLHDAGVGIETGNFLAAKKIGVVGGIDYGSTGEVEKLDVSRMRELLDKNIILILSNLGYSSSGEVLNCCTYEVATACALAMGARIYRIADGKIVEFGLYVRSMNLGDADMLI